MAVLGPCEACGVAMALALDACPSPGCGAPHAHGRLVRAVEAGDVGLDPTFELTPRSGAPAWLHDALATIGGRVAAYRALGLPMAPVDAAMQWRAAQLAQVLELVAGSDVAPQQMIDVATRLVEQWVAGAVTGAGSWALVLEGILSCPIITADAVQKRLRHKAKERESKAAQPRNQEPVVVPDAGKRYQHARAVLASLRASVPAADLPAKMRNPTDAMLRDAEHAITESVSRTDDARLVTRPLQITRGKTGGRSGAISPWGAAVRFAAAFGEILTKKSNVGRTRKTERTRRRTAPKKNRAR
jgi:hypothetical protein